MNYSVCGNALHLPYPDGVAQVCVTSPPYYGARRYLPAGHPDEGKEIGREESPSAYVANIVAAMREVWRVLRPDATAWVNLGDMFASGWSVSRQSKIGQGAPPLSERQNRLHDGLKEKDLMGLPWAVAFALRDDGWYLRQGITWCKKSAMPESVRDRPTSATEMVFLLAKRPHYFYDAEAIAEPSGGANGSSFTSEYDRETKPGLGMGERAEAATRNARNFWVLGPAPYSGSHFATMPPELARRCILAGSSARGQCPRCGAPWVRQVERRLENTEGWGKASKDHHANTQGSDAIARNGQGRAGDSVSTTTGWAASCDCHAGDPVPQLVLDPFAGSGTTAMCALQAGRRAIGTELNPAYLRLQDQRTQVTMGLGF